MSPRVTLIAALDLDGVIGREGGLPWRLRADLAHFRRSTMGKPIVMGRKTFESIGRPLDGRLNIVLSARPDFEVAGVTVATSVQDALKEAAGADEIMVIGGASVYEAFMPLATDLLLTRVDASVAGDTFFPAFDVDEWDLLSSDPHGADETNEYPFEFLTYRRRPRAK